MQKQPDLVQRASANAKTMRKLLQHIDGLQVMHMLVALVLHNLQGRLMLQDLINVLSHKAHCKHLQRQDAKYSCEATVSFCSKALTCRRRRRLLLPGAFLVVGTWATH